MVPKHSGDEYKLQYLAPTLTPNARLFKIALSISVFLHGLVLFVVSQREHSATHEITTVKSTFHLFLSSSPPDEFDEISTLEETVEVEKSDPLPKSPSQPPQKNSIRKVVDIAELSPDEKDPEEPPPVLKLVEVPEPRLKRSAPSLIKALVEQDRIEAFEASIAPSCTPTQRATQVRICDSDESDVTQQAALTAYEGTFSDAFRDLSTTSSEFHRDMARVENLNRRQEELADLDSFEGLESALIAQERAYIREEILRIDRKYAQVNLLKLIPIGRKVLKGLWEAATGKN